MSEDSILVPPAASSLPDNADQQIITEPEVIPSDPSGIEHIAGLEEQVVKLEKKVKELTKNLLDERSMYESQLSAKNTGLDALRIKVNRLEFATKEAVIFLSKPVEKTKQPMNTSLSNAVSNGTIHSVASSKTSIPSKKKSNDASRGESAEKSKSQQKGSSSNGTIQPNSAVSSTLTPFEAECLECIRYSIRYLKNAQAATNHVSPAGHLRPGAPIAGCGTTEGEFKGNNKSERDQGGEISGENIISKVNASDEPLSALQRRTSAKYNKSNTTNNATSSRKVVGSPTPEEVKVPNVEVNHSLWAQGNATTNLPTKPFQQDDGKLFPKYHPRARSVPPSLGVGYGGVLGDADDGDSDITSGDISENLAFSPVTGGAGGGIIMNSGKFSSHSSASFSRTTMVPQQPANRGLLGTKCLHCRELSLQIDRHNDVENDLRSDIAALTTKLAEEQVGHAQTAMSKGLLEQELEDLTATLFDQANHMVMEESAMRDALEKKNRDLEGKLEENLISFAAREEEMSSLRRTLKSLESARKRSLSRTGSINAFTGENVGRGSQQQGRSNFSSESSLDSSDGISSGSRLARFVFRDRVDPNAVHVDALTYNEFQDHIKAAAKATASTYATLPTNFLKRVMSEDIEPCLFQGSTGWKLPFLKNKLLNAIIKDTIEIRHWLAKNKNPDTESSVSIGTNNKAPSDKSSSSATSTGKKHTQSDDQKPSAPVSNPPQVKCSACGFLRHCEYQIRLDASDTGISHNHIPFFNTSTSSSGVPEIDASSWQPLDRFCRDRVIAVCDFYLYLSQLRQGLLGKSAPLLGMFRQCVWYRRRMGLARIGNTELFEGMDGQSIKRLSVGDLEGKKIMVIP